MRGANAVQVQSWLGHHSAAFTLSAYVHLLPNELGEPLALADELAEGRETWTTAGHTDPVWFHEPEAMKGHPAGAMH